MAKKEIKKIVLAYSGGLDTSIILKWLKNEYGCKVIAFAADLGQGDELAPVRDKAIATGADKVYIDDLREEFVKDFRVPDVPGQRYLRRILPARHLHCPAADRQAADGDRQNRKGRRRGPWRHRQGQRPGPLRTGLLPFQPGH